MKKILSADQIVTEALMLLNEAGIDGISTRKIAKQLGVEQPALYWHFKHTARQLQAMAEAAMQTHWNFPLPEEGQDVKTWLINNLKSFRHTLLLYRDGARLHAFHVPGDDSGRLEQKISFLVGQGIDENDAKLALMTASKFTVGFVLEEQQEGSLTELNRRSQFFIADKELMYERGLELILSGIISE